MTIKNLAIAVLFVSLAATESALAEPFRCRPASLDEGKRLITADDPYILNATEADYGRAIGRKSATKEEYKAFAAGEVREFTGRELMAVSNSFERLNATFRKLGYQAPFTNEVVIVKTTMREQFGAGGYTRGKTIYLNMDNLVAPDEFLDMIMSHELFHVLTRSDAEFKKKMYATIGFTMCEEIKFPDEVRSHIMNNPDVESFDAKAVFTIDGKPTEAVIVAYLPDLDRKGRGALRSMRAAVVPVDDPGRAIMSDQVPDFWNVVGRNTEYVIAAEECLADNFSFACLRYGNPVGYAVLPTPEIPERIISVLKGEDWRKEASAPEEDIYMKGARADWLGDLETAKAAYEQGAREGNGECLQALGERLLTGRFGKIDKKEAFILFKRSAEAGYSQGAWDLGLALLRGEGCERDEAGGRAWLAKAVELAKADLAASNRVADAHLTLSFASDNGLGGAARDMKAARGHRLAILSMDEGAVDPFTMLAAASDALAEQPESDRFYRRPEAAKAIAWLAKHAADNEETCELTSAIPGIPGQSGYYEKKATERLKALMEKGDIEAMMLYGMDLAMGAYGETKEEEGYRLLETAASKGLSWAKIEMALNLREGEGVEKDCGKAIALLDEAAAEGEPQALLVKAVWTLQGECGLNADEKEALRLLGEAAKRADDDALDINSKRNRVKALRKAGMEQGFIDWVDGK
ncbi:MAG: hypothetical protein K6F50_00625 [Kiritimatiellae bacterium]|nr:hypothetical protein [Kiritimatiellia bacterium]